jgi:hypothetical protein
MGKTYSDKSKSIHWASETESASLSGSRSTHWSLLVRVLCWQRWEVIGLEDLVDSRPFLGVDARCCPRRACVVIIITGCQIFIV